MYTRIQSKLSITIQIKYNFLQFRVKTQLYMLYFKKSSSKNSTILYKEKKALPETRKETQCKGCRNHESN